MSQRQVRYYEFGPFRLDAHERVLRQNGKPVHLTLKVFQLLLVLVEHSGKMLEKNELLERVWPDTIVEEANLKNAISTLRKALGGAGGADAYIQTLPKRGYRFVAPVTRWPDDDETYLIEKHTTAEIVIDSISQDISTGDGDLSPIETDSSAVIAGLPSGGEAASLTSGEAAMMTVAGAGRAPQRLPDKVSFSRRLLRHRWAVGIGLGVVVIVVAACSIGLYRWISSKAWPSFSVEQMKVAQLTNVGNGTAIISPDGKYFAYVMNGTPTDGLWIKQRATDSTVKLLPRLTCWGLGFSPDSNYVYCNLPDDDHPDGLLYKIPALGGLPKLVLENLGGGVSFSPDAKRMAFRRINKAVGTPDLITAGVDGSDERIIIPANPRSMIWSISWSPDGQRIAFSARDRLGEEQNTWQVREVAAAGGAERAITAPQKETITAITWLPDGSGMIMTAADKDTRLPQLWHLAYPGGQARRITNDSNHYGGVSITADGGTILAQRAIGGSNLWLGDAAALNNLRKITADGGDYDELSWTPDGRILYSEGDNGKSDLWIMNLDGTGRQRLTNDQSQNRWPVMASDGRTLVYSSPRSGQRQIWRSDSDGRNAKQLTDWPEGADHPRLTPDNQRVLCQTWRAPGFLLRSIPLDGGEFVTLADRAREFVISPDGKLLAYESFDEQKKRSVIVVKPVDGGEPIRVFDYPDFPIFRIAQWTKDGLLCIKNDSTQLILMPVDGHPPSQLSDFKTGERIFSCALSSDGRQLALALGISTNETLLLTNFKPR